MYRDFRSDTISTRFLNIYKFMILLEMCSSILINSLIKVENEISKLMKEFSRRGSLTSDCRISIQW